MSEVFTEVKMFEVDKICTECNYGRMRSGGTALMSCPAKYLHNCNKCGHQETYLVQYPYTTYKSVEG